ncbi:hypothetical protein [Oryzihumus sp.]
MKALLSVKAVPGAKVAGYWLQESPDTPKVAGIVESLRFVSGDPSCRQLLEGHPVPPRSSVGLYLDSPDVRVVEAVQSFFTVEDAAQVMAQNASQLKSCHRFIAAMNGHLFIWTHTQTIVSAKSQPVRVDHQIWTTFDGGCVIRMCEVRVGGEVLFLHLNPASLKGQQMLQKIVITAAAVFRAAVGAYRAAHPRPS